MYIILTGCAQQNVGTALLMAFDAGGTDAVDIFATAGSGVVSTLLGEIDITASASGGDGSYSFSWTVTEADDPTNSFAVNSLGVRNNSRYNSLTINATIPANVFDPPETAIYTLRCTVTDGTGSSNFVEKDIILTVHPT
tara:strand:+ start:208 stop:624 length:417 start_codon:yes stop_codon:yes gene_type:complete